MKRQYLMQTTAIAAIVLSSGYAMAQNQGQGGQAQRQAQGQRWIQEQAQGDQEDGDNQ